ncbi:MAG TPA: P27 family phage terminase small subunit [Afipia sp.]
MRGRKPLPTELKALSGTLRKHRQNPSEPSGTPGRPDTPSWLSSRAAELFASTCDAMAERGTLAVEWRDAIAAYAASLEDIEIATAAIRRHGATYTTHTATGDVIVRPRPETAMRSEALRRAHVLRTELGLGPVASLRVAAAPVVERNPYANLD